MTSNHEPIDSAARQPTPTESAGDSRRSKRTRISLRYGIVVALLGCGGLGTAAFYVLPWMMPLPAPLRVAGPASGADARAGSALEAESAGSLTGEKPAVVPAAELPQSFISAMVATQDPDFWTHGGTDTRRVAGALTDAAGRGRLASGGSTITEQLAKMTTARDGPRSIQSRLVDALTARRIELSLTKNQILEHYIARLPFGNDFTGLPAAAAGYFGKSPAELTLAECVFLAVLPDAPSRLNPHRHFADAKARQEKVLRELAASGQITLEEARLASEAPILLRPAP